MVIYINITYTQHVPTLHYVCTYYVIWRIFVSYEEYLYSLCYGVSLEFILFTITVSLMQNM